MSKRPTDEAIDLFDLAKGPMRGYLHDINSGPWFQLGATMINLLNGLQSMAVAQRATYLKLEEIERKIDALRR